MKKYFFLPLLLLAQLALGQVDVFIPNGGKAATQEYVKVYLDGLLQKIGPGTVTPPDTIGTDPGTPTTPTTCTTAPVVQSINSPSRTGLNFSYIGLNVTDIVWYIKSGTNIIRQGSVSGLSPNPSITYQQIDYGSYTLEIKGISCPQVSPAVFFTLQSPPVVDPGGEVSGDLPPYSVTPKKLITIVNNAGVYSDNEPGDYQQDGVTYRDANGRKYRALYWFNEIPWQKPDGSPKEFKNVTFPNGLLVTIRKEYADVNWAGSQSHQKFIDRGWDVWLHGGENPQADGNFLLATVISNIVTNNGATLSKGDFNREEHPSWIRADQMVPLFFSNQTVYRSDKPVTLQAFPVLPNDLAETRRRLVNGGPTHLWWQNFHAVVDFYNNGPRDGLKFSYNNASIEFFYAHPEIANNDRGQANQQQARSTADRVYLEDDIVITDEFSEGLPYPQLEQSREWYYQRLNERIIAGNFKNIQNLGDYGYGSQNLTLTGDGWNFDPTGDYMLNLVNSTDPKNALSTVSGSNHLKYKQYAQYYSGYRDHVVGAYYAIPFLSQDRTPNRFLEAVIMNNTVPDRKKSLFTVSAMQSNAHGADVPYKDSGTILPDGSVNQDYPDTPAEMMKFDAFTSLILYDGFYLWDYFGAKDINSKWWKSGLGLDMAMIGARMYAKIIPQLNESGRDIWAADYTSNGSVFTSSATERRIPRTNQPRYGNRYFNDAIKQKRGTALVINSSKKVIIYVNSYLKPNEIENVVVTFQGRNYNIGQVAGSCMVVCYEK